MAVIMLPPDMINFMASSYRDSNYSGLSIEDLSPITSQSFGGQMPSVLQPLLKQFEEYRQRLGALDTLLKTSGPRNYEVAIDALELALTRVYKLAAFLRGGADEDTKKALFAQAVQGFKNVDDAAAFGLRQHTEIADQIKSLQSGVGPTLRRDINSMAEQARSDVDSRQEASRRIEGELNSTASSMNQARSHFEEAQRQSQELSNQFRGNPFLYGPLAGLIGGNIDGMNRARAQAEEAQQRMRYLEQNMYRLQQQGQQVYAEIGEARQKQLQLENFQQMLPMLSAGADALDQQANRQMKGFTQLKEHSSEMVTLAQEVGTRSDGGSIAPALIRICASALINERVTDEVEMIRNEIQGSDQQKSPELDNALSKLTSSLEDLKNAQYE